MKVSKATNALLRCAVAAFDAAGPAVLAQRGDLPTMLCYRQGYV
jgi:hypothetical protein